MYSQETMSLAELHQQRFYECITSGRLYKMRLLLEDDTCQVDVNSFDENGLTPMMLACALEDDRGKTRNQILRLLLNKGADPNIPDHRGINILTWGCMNQKVDIVRLLINKAAVDIDFNAPDFSGDTALMHAVRTQNASLVRILVKMMRKLSINIDKRNHSDVTPYLEAKKLRGEEIISILRNDGNASEFIQICPLFQNEEEPNTTADAEIVQSVRPTLASEMRTRLTAQNKNKLIKNYRTWNNDFKAARETNVRKNTVNRAKNSPFESTKVKKGASVQLTHGKNDQKDKVRGTKSMELTNKLSSARTGTKREVDTQKLPSNRKEVQRETQIVEGVESNAPEKGVNQEIDNMENKDKLQESEDKNNNIEERSEAKIESYDYLKSEVEIKRSTQSHNSLNIIQDEEIEDEVFSEEIGPKSPKSAWQRRLQTRSPKSPTDRQSRTGLERAKKSEAELSPSPLRNEYISADSAITGGMFQRMSLEKPTRHWQDQRGSSHLSVKANSNSPTLKSRPGSAYFNNERRSLELTRRPASAAATRRIGFEEIYQLCPEMRESGKRQWYSDLRWMLALRAHQNNATYLPAQPERPSNDETTVVEVRVENEAGRTGRRMSVFGNDMKRPGLRKRPSALSSIKN